MSRDDHEAEGAEPGGDSLNGFFAAARATAPQPSDALMARVQADAARAAAAMAPPRAGRPGGWGRVVDRVVRWRPGGAGAVVAGLAAAALSGLWLGLAGSDAVATLETALWGADPLLGLEAEFDLLLAELAPDPEAGP